MEKKTENKTKSNKQRLGISENNKSSSIVTLPQGEQTRLKVPEMIIEDLLNLGKDINLQIQKDQRLLRRITHKEAKHTPCTSKSTS